jgi:hypothetical protein
MNILELNTVIGLGDLIFLKAQLDGAKDRFDEIRISYDNHILQMYRNNNPGYIKFLNDIGELFFKEHPYKLNIGQYPKQWPSDLCKRHNIPMILPKLQHLLCKGILLNIDREYIVITTKIRYISKSYYTSSINQMQFWHIMRQLSDRYKIVIMGEKVVEMNKEYTENGHNVVYSIYNDIMREIPNDRILDLTIPALGVTSPTLNQIQQDCLIMSEAKFVISFGIGGNLQLSVAVANTVNFRCGAYADTDMLYGESKTYDDSITTKDFNQFLSKLKSYI